MIEIITDSTSDITLQEAKKYGITVVPLTVHFGDEEFLDGVTITPHEFYEKLIEYALKYDFLIKDDKNKVSFSINSNVNAIICSCFIKL